MSMLDNTILLPKLQLILYFFDGLNKPNAFYILNV